RDIVVADRGICQATSGCSSILKIRFSRNEKGRAVSASKHGFDPIGPLRKNKNA
ncbi:hypothetical protein PROFUN_16903, partial [Planoprotostelium fungivorum]